MTKFDAVEPLINILSELVDGPPMVSAYVLNACDAGLLKSLNGLSAKDASAIPPNGGASIAAHVDHLCYGFELLNRWSKGEEPFATADYAASWDRIAVSNSEWRERIHSLTREIETWRESMKNLRDLTATEQNGVVASVVHLAYHFGAIRQINRGLRGPSAREAIETDLDPEQLG